DRPCTALASSFRWHSRSSPHAFTFFARQSGVVIARAGAMPPASTIHAATAARIAPPRAPLSPVPVRIMSSLRGARSSEGRAHLPSGEGGAAVACPDKASDEAVGEVQEPHGAGRLVPW